MSTDPLVLVERVDGYAVLTLNRPEKRNAISRALAAELGTALAAVEDVPVVVITGAGDKAFCAGIDLKERAEDVSWRSMLGAEHGHLWMDTLEQMRRHPAVFVAAVNGAAVGGGLTLVNNSELAVAAATATFGMPELGFGAFPALAGPSTIRRIAPKHVAQMVLTVERIAADTALQWGLVNEVVQPDRLMDRAGAIAAALADRDPVALAFCKKGLRDLEVMDWSAGLQYGTTLSNVVKRTKAAGGA